MKKLLGFLLVLMLPFLGKAVVVKKDLSEAISDKSITLKAVNFVGGYTGKTTRLSVTNTTKSVLVVKVNLGVILSPDEPGYQPMVLAGEEMLVVQPDKENHIDVMTFCGNSPQHCPKKELTYSFSRVGSDTLVKVLQFIKTNSLYNSLGQSAVWCITNAHPLSDIYDSEQAEMANRLLELMIKVTGKPRPDYYTVANTTQVADEPAYTPKALKIIAEFELLLEAPKTLSLGVYNEEGKMIQEIVAAREFSAMGHRFGVEFESSNVPAGRYYIRLKEGETVIKEKMVKVE